MGGVDKYAQFHNEGDLFQNPSEIFQRLEESMQRPPREKLMKLPPPLRDSHLQVVEGGEDEIGPQVGQSQAGLRPQGGTPIYKPYEYVPAQRVWFQCHLSLKTGIDFPYFGLDSGMVFEETTVVYECICCFNSK